MHMGYGFYWRPGQKPILVAPDGKVIPLLVNRDIPYLSVGTRQPGHRGVPLVLEATGVAAVEQLVVSSVDGAEQENPMSREGEPPERVTAPDAEHEPSVTEKLRQEAQSLNHKLHHLPKNPFCDACVTGKMKEIGGRRGVSEENRKVW